VRIDRDATTSGFPLDGTAETAGPSSITSMARRTMSHVSEKYEAYERSIWCPTFLRVSKASTCRYRHGAEIDMPCLRTDGASAAVPS